jgi:protein SCO1/2
MSSRLLNILGGLTVAIMASLALLILTYGGSPAPSQSAGASRHGGPFTMVDGYGRTVTERDFKDRPLAIFFGFTRCADVCPTTLIEMADLMAKLGADADRMTVLFVTVDPERDTIEIMRDYAEAFDKRIVGLTGTTEQVAAMAKAWGVYFKKVPTTDGDYTMDHTAGVFLVTGKGSLKGTLDLHDRTPGVNLAKLRALVR